MLVEIFSRDYSCLPAIFRVTLTMERRGRSHWSRSLRRVSTAARLLELRVRIQPGAWMFVCCDCCVLSDRGLCDGPITRPEESCLVWCV
jgi:hypothetical protein